MSDLYNRVAVLVLAAGKGTRMRSKTPKVLHKILEEPILYYPLKSVQNAGFDNVAVVVGSGGENVEAWTAVNFPGVKIVWQREQKGTGHAALLAQSWWRNFDSVMVLAGDVPLITPETLKKFA